MQQDIGKWMRVAGACKVRATLTDGEIRTVGIGLGRKRYGTAAAEISKLSWGRLEALNKGGDILASIESAEEREGMVATAAISAHAPRELAFAELLSRYSLGMVAEYRRANDSVNQRYADLVDVLARRLGALEGSYAKVLALAEQAALSGKEDQGDEWIAQLVDLAKTDRDKKLAAAASGAITTITAKKEKVE